MKYTTESLSALKRPALVQLAKAEGVRANMKSQAIIAALLENIKGEAAPKTPAFSKSRAPTQEDLATPDLQNLTYNEIRSIAKATPGVKVSRGKGARNQT